MRESAIEKNVTDFAKRKGWLSFKWVSTSQRGVPDRLFFKGGEVKMVEFKAPGKHPTLYQQAIHQRLLDAGFEVAVVDDVEKGRALFC
jgi:hypothetical protein